MALLTMAPLTMHGYVLTMALHVHAKAAPVQRGLSIGPERSGANFVIKVYTLTLTPALTLTLTLALARILTLTLTLSTDPDPDPNQCDERRRPPAA